jgi:S1-C subfamily serine protease
MRQHLVGKGWLGLGVLTLTPKTAHLARVPISAKGVLVAVVMPGSAAASAGFRPGEVIYAVNGRPVTTARTLVTAIERLRPGTSVTVAVMHGSLRREIHVAVEQRPSAAV